MLPSREYYISSITGSEAQHMKFGPSFLRPICSSNHQALTAYTIETTLAKDSSDLHTDLQ